IGASDRTARVLPLSAAAFAALTTSIAASLYRAWLLLPSADGSGVPAVVATGAVEAAILFVVVWQLRMLHRHAALATSVAAQGRSSRKARTSA
ncbi:hypothetical protein, partial [Sphingomonas sp.]|uniref:hypothetical protein n=1 Tax=Sphingomonas sp. TaxID=28214 RepID=UPI002DB94381